MSTLSSSSRRSPRLAAALLAATALTLSACGTDAPAPAPSSGQPGTSSGAATPLALAQGLAGDEGATKGGPAEATSDPSPKSAKTDQSAEARLTLTQIRVGEHEGHDRVVLEFGGTGTPGYDVQYVDSAAQQGSGRPVDVPGQSFLQVSATGQVLPMETGLTEVSVGAVSTPDGSGLAGVAFGGQFEGTAQTVIGLKGGKKPFTVFTLQNPTRLVVDMER